MTASFAVPRVPLLVFTDLDGSLLDHDDYSFTAARPALSRLRDYGVPLLPVTSKTLAEVRVLQQELQNPHPFIVENGSAICIPDDYFPGFADTELQEGLRLLRLALPHAVVLAVLAGLHEQGFRFRGFSDMSVGEIACDTGLTATAAQHARQRLCTEPVLWEDSEEALEQFRAELGEQGLRLVRGGRYWHVMADTDKALAMQKLTALYQTRAGRRFTTLALGDSPNDRAMLAAADIAAVIPRKDGGRMEIATASRVINTGAPGPEGWNTAVLQVLQELLPAATASI